MNSTMQPPLPANPPPVPPVQPSMPPERGPIARFFIGLWDAMNFTRRLAFNLLFFGLLLLVLLGLGLLVIVIGAGLFAEESLLIARLLDRIDLLLTRRVRRWRAARAARTARPSR